MSVLLAIQALLKLLYSFQGARECVFVILHSLFLFPNFRASRCIRSTRPRSAFVCVSASLANFIALDFNCEWHIFQFVNIVTTLRNPVWLWSSLKMATALKLPLAAMWSALNFVISLWFLVNSGAPGWTCLGRERVFIALFNLRATFP